MVAGLAAQAGRAVAGRRRALKLAGEAAGQPVPGLARVVALGRHRPGRCSSRLALPRNRLYEAIFLRELIADAKARQRTSRTCRRSRFQADDGAAVRRPVHRPPQRLRRRAGLLPPRGVPALVGSIPVPTLVLTSRDDPFIAVEPFEELKAPGHVTVRILRHGGHLGFLGWDGAGASAGPNIV